MRTTYHTTMVDGRDCVASTVDVSNPVYFKHCLDSTAWLTATNLVPRYAFEKVYVPVSSAVYLYFSVITVPVALEWPLSITYTFREIGPHQISKIKNANLMDKFMAYIIYPGGRSIHIPYWRKNLIAHLMLGHRPDSFAPTLFKRCSLWSFPLIICSYYCPQWFVTIRIIKLWHSMLSTHIHLRYLIRFLYRVLMS